MDQLDFESKIEKLKNRREEGDFKTAVKIADKIPWDEVNDINVIMLAASVYEEAEKYTDSKFLLEYAYDIAPVKNRLFFALSYISCKCGDMKDAVNYYMDFCHSFPDDNRSKILKYEIMKGKGAPYEQQKRILVEYLKEEKDEKLSWELALICDKLQIKDEVLEVCNFIVEYYGVKKNGYGKNALLLKKKYIDLTEREEKLLKSVDIEFEKNKLDDVEYQKPPELINETRLKNEQVNIPIIKLNRETNLELQSEEQEKINELFNRNDDILEENKIENKINMTYTPDEESYKTKEKENMAFLNSKSQNKEKLKKLIEEIKKEEIIGKTAFGKLRLGSFELKRRLINMKLSDTKLHMIIEAHSKDEGIEIAKKELSYIHDVLGEKVQVAKVSAYNINEKGFSNYVDKILDKDLIIESAGKLKNKAIDDIEEYIINQKGKTIFALIDVINNFDDLATDRNTFVKRFDIYSVLSERPQEILDVTKEEIEEFKNKKNKVKEINVSIKKEEKKEINKSVKKTENTGFSVDGFVEECKKYAKSIDCNLQSEAIPLIYERAEDLKSQRIELNAESAAALIEEAADRAEKPKMFKKPKYDKEGLLILSEQHFQF